MNPVFADTYYFLALLHKSDAARAKAVALAERVTNPILTTAWVLTEIGDALAAPAHRPRFLQLLEALGADPGCTIVPSSPATFDAGVALYAERSDKGWTLTDCISFVVMRQYGVTEALTGDRHFEQAGFDILLT
ncbi:MAG: PIN domain-containing protein [Acidobacteriia bacterium]|nr:PIN domain-containing protein [Terriglobia bacterium]